MTKKHLRPVRKSNINIGTTHNEVRNTYDNFCLNTEEQRLTLLAQLEYYRGISGYDDSDDQLFDVADIDETKSGLTIQVLLLPWP